MGSQLSDNNYKVYKHTCPNGKVYIGITKDSVKNRWESGWGYKSNIHFFKAIVKYGWINIKHEVLFEGLSKEDAEKKEIELIAQYRSSDRNYGYNFDLGGFLHNVYEKDREEIKKFKAGAVLAERERLRSIEYVDKIVGRKVYKYTLDGNLIQVFNSCKEAAEDAGVTYPSFQRWVRGKHPKKAKYRYTYGEFNDAENKQYKQTFNAKPVDMFDMGMNLVKTFSSIADAARYVKEVLGYTGNSATSNIHSVCNGAYSNSKRRRLTAYNYIWRYHNEDKNNKVA